MKTWYLAHQLKNRQEIRKIQKYIEANYKIFLFNPFYDTQRKEIVDMDANKTDRYSFEVKDCKRIMNDDLMWIRNCDGLLCILDSKYDALGSLLEIFYASKILDKPVYLVCPMKKIREHLWIRALTFKSFRNLKELEAYFIDNDMVMK